MRQQHDDPENANTAAVAFGIDTEVLTFGREIVGLGLAVPVWTSCIERLLLKRKVCATGLIVDGRKVYPNLSSFSPTTIPLTNKIEFEIHGKRFKFTYSPKERRAQLNVSPAKSRSRTLRMSVINSAQVFSPRPSPNPLEHLHILKSPLNAAPLHSSIRKSASPLRDIEDEVVGNYPRVVGEDGDLVILELARTFRMQSRLPSPTKPSNMNGYIQAPSSAPLLELQAQQLSRLLKTPTCSNLHKAVLVLSTHGTVLTADVAEEMEVLVTLAEDKNDEWGKESLKVLRMKLMRNTLVLMEEPWQYVTI
ncbi:hypothetical protein VKT23_008689 [Stygiomarasmius scandens]|uniref:Uncharacterized protein n=1 Tax=Marasmiellus scandens TaxID=2682957 RepID=A0ABR1JLT6_9AGAR